jgi:hypothetical protein
MYKELQQYPNDDVNRRRECVLTSGSNKLKRRDQEAIKTTLREFGSDATVSIPLF